MNFDLSNADHFTPHRDDILFTLKVIERPCFKTTFAEPFNPKIYFTYKKFETFQNAKIIFKKCVKILTKTVKT